jgi:hypothetical protein
MLSNKKTRVKLTSSAAEKLYEQEQFEVLIVLTCAQEKSSHRQTASGYRLIDLYAGDTFEEKYVDYLV